LGPYGALVGTDPGSLRGQPTTGRARANWASYDNVRPRGILPALLEPELDGVDPGQWIAVALNGTIAGVGPVYASPEGAKAVALLDPSYFRKGRNRVDLYLVTAGGQVLRPIALER